MEHRIILGGEIYLPFARSRIKALRATGLEYASQQFEIGGASVKVRIMPGHEYIYIEESSGYASVFSSVQYPELVPEESNISVKSLSKAKLLTGSFGASVITPGRDEPVFISKTRFGTNPYAPHWIRRSQGTIQFASVNITPFATGSSAYAVYARTGVIIGATIRYDIFADGVLKEQQVLQSPYFGRTTTDDTTAAKWSTSTSEFTPIVGSDGSARMALLATDTTEKYFSEGTFLREHDDTSYYRTVVGTATESGSSRLVIKSQKTNTANSSSLTYQSTEVAQLNYSRSNTLTTEPRTLNVLDDDVKLDLGLYVTNDVECSMAYRRWHAMERLSTAPNGIVYVLRETNNLEVHDVKSLFESSPQGVVPRPAPLFSVAISRGYTLSAVSPSNAVYNHVVTGDLGPHGYIDGIFPSANGKKVFVYYGVHDASESLPPITLANFSTFLPLKFIEKLDVVEVVATDNGYTFAKKETIVLGPVKLRTYGTFLGDDGYPTGELTDYPDYVAARTDHFNSFLHGAALEVAGFIWANRYCYDVKNGTVLKIPDFVEYVVPPKPFTGSNARDQITGPENDRASYLCVSSDGLSATYAMFRSGFIQSYKITRDSTTGTRKIVADGVTQSIVGGGSYDEYPFAEAAQFNKSAGIK